MDPKLVEQHFKNHYDGWVDNWKRSCATQSCIARSCYYEGYKLAKDEIARLDRFVTCTLDAMKDLVDRNTEQSEVIKDLMIEKLHREIPKLPPVPDPYEYRITDGQRKAWDGTPDLSEDGWEEYKEWERFDYHEERYWRRKKENSNVE